MAAMLTLVLKLFVKYFKHRLLKIMYPEPNLVEVLLPPKLTMERTMCEALVSNSMNDYVHLITDDDCNNVSVQIDDGTVVDGVFAVGRYLGRLALLYPTNPINALTVDASLEKLQSFVHTHNLSLLDKSQVERMLSNLDNEVKNKEWLYDFNSRTIADMYWLGAVQYLIYTEQMPQDWSELYPAVNQWVCRCTEIAMTNSDDSWTQESLTDVEEDETARSCKSD